jgi:hypothetical protein
VVGGASIPFQYVFANTYQHTRCMARIIHKPPEKADLSGSNRAHTDSVIGAETGTASVKALPMGANGVVASVRGTPDGLCLI